MRFPLTEIAFFNEMKIKTIDAQIIIHQIRSCIYWSKCVIAIDEQQNCWFHENTNDTKIREFKIP